MEKYEWMILAFLIVLLFSDETKEDRELIIILGLLFITDILDGIKTQEFL